jgi:D-proline reductase (dithiol) PrdB
LHFCLIRKSREWIQGLWETINERYPGSMIRKDSYVPLAQLGKPLAEVARDVTEAI